MLYSSFSILFLAIAAGVDAQLSGRVGPLTTAAKKASTKTCNVLNYGAKADGATDLGPALSSAWNDCKTGGLVYIPPGTYAMATWVSLNSGSASAIQLDGTIVRTGTAGGNMISINHCSDFEFFSGNSKGAMQGYGYQYISKNPVEYGARFVRLTDVTNYSFHGVALVDSASYYLVFDSTSNGEIYNIIIRGISIGMTDGIDIWGTNIWVHDVEVTNGDECVCVKSPSKNLLIESIHCNISGGTSIGSLGLDTSVANVQYKNLYMNSADACYLKTNGGSGTVSDISWTNVIIHGGAYILAVNEAWGTDRGGKGVQVKNLSFKNWKGFNTDNSRPVIRLECDDDYPCTGLSVSDVNLWSAEGGQVTWVCQSAYGTGACLRSGSGGAYAASYTTIKTAPSYSTATMPNDLASPFPSTKSFAIPAVPTTYFPGLKPISSLLTAGGAGATALAAMAVPTGAAM